MPDHEAAVEFRTVGNPPLGEQLRSKRLAESKSQATLATFFGVTQQTIAAWEGGGRPEPKHFRQLSDYLQLGGEEKTVALLDAHAKRQLSHDAPNTIDLHGRTREEMFAEVVSHFLAQQSGGGQLSEGDAAVYAALIEKLGPAS